MKILIAGAGKRGGKLLEVFKDIQVQVTAFLDNDTKKHRTEIMGLPCYPLDAFEQEQDCVVFVSPEHAEELCRQTKEIYGVVFGENMVNSLLIHPKGYQRFYEIGDYYSLYPQMDDVLKKPDWPWQDILHTIQEINFNESVQYDILKRMMELYCKVPQWPYLGQEESKYRYRLGNASFSCGDAIGLFTMLQIIHPKRLIEVGSGYTSMVTLDVNEFFLNNSIELAFIEPYPHVLESLLKPEDKIELHVCGLQDMPLDYFNKLEDGDILFIDSTHVSKYGSDVNYLFFEILPMLKKGVYVHLHDIFYPFEYPQEWIKKGMVWNELYLLRAFLEYNDSFEIIYFQNMMEKCHRQEIEEKWPLSEPIQGGSFWMRKK